MNRLLTFSILLCAFFSATVSFAQVSLTASGGTATGTYSTLKAAFDAINAGTHTGTIAITITGSTTETASAVLNASGAGSASYESISIQPSGAAVVSGGIFGHLIDLNGADNVTIDGLNTGGNSLTISNTGTSSASAIRFFGDASNNTIVNCSIQGATTIFGVVYFGGGTTTGNDNNLISQCNIGPVVGNNPLNGIYSMGTSAAIDNSGNTISNNNIYDYYNSSSITNGMNINSGNSAWTITGNKFYQTANRVYTSAGTHNGIFITSGSGYTITDNIIGYANAGGTGTTNMIGLTSGSLGGTFPSAYTVGGAANATRYVAINCAFTSGGTVSSIQNNTIAGFALYTSASVSSTSGNFCGIAVTSGNVNIGNIAGNTIGTPGASIYTCSTATSGIIAGIYVTSQNTVNIQNNTIQNLDAMGTVSTTTGGINGINTEGAGGTVLVSGNIIGNTGNPNLRMGNLTTGSNLSNTGSTFGTSSGTGIFQGIRNAQTGTVTIGTIGAPNIIRNATVNSTASLALFRGILISGGTTIASYNTISNLTTAGAGTSYGSGGLAGIGILVTSGVTVGVMNNTISDLSLTNTGTGGYTLAGIVSSSPTATPITSLTISKNKINNLSNASTSVSTTAPGTATGIFIREGGGAVTSIDNNMISLGYGQTTNTTFIGIWPQYNSSLATILKIYYNSINIEGSVTAGSQPSMCLQRGDISSTTAGTTFSIDAKDNIFNNIRTGGTGKHYAISNNYGATASSATGWGSSASNYNLLTANTSTVGYWTGDQTFVSWQTASASDNNSVTGDPKFVSAADLHIQTSQVSPVSNAGTPLASVAVDIDGDSRTSTPDIGADEYTSTIFAITFNVDMSTAEGFIPGTDIVYLTGSFTGWAPPGDPGSIVMNQVGTSLTYTTTLLLASGTYEYKYFKNAGWGNGEYLGGSNRSVTISAITIYNDTWGGAITWANLQWPGTGSIDLGGAYDIYAQAYIPNGITYAPGATYGLQAWIGYSTSNTNPSTWTNWIPAPFFGQAFDNDEFKVDLGSAIAGTGTYYYASRFQFGTNGAYLYGGFSGTNGGFWDGSTNVSGVLTVNATTKTLSLTSVFLEGLYDPTTGSMNQAKGTGGLPQFGDGIADQVTVELHNSTNPATIEYTASNVDLSTSGVAVITIPASYSGSYYITIKHRNSIETATKVPVSFGTSTINYALSTNTQAYGDYLKNVNGTFPNYVIYTGDVNQDKSVGVLDMTAVDNKSKSFATGYLVEDINGDGSVGVLDMTIIDNNSKLFVSSHLPY